MKDLSKVFFNSVEEMNECYGIDAELPSDLQSNADLVCYEIVEPSTYGEVCQYKFERGVLEYFSFVRWCNSLSNVDNEILLNRNDCDIYEGRCFVYVRVNDYLRKHLGKSLLGCEFVCRYGSKCVSERRFVESVEVIEGGTPEKHIFVTDQDGYSVNLINILLYPDDYSDPTPYKEWVKKINEQDVEVED